MAVIMRNFREPDRNNYIKMSKSFYSSPAVSHYVPIQFFNETFDLCLQKGPYVRGLIIEYDGQTAGYMLLSFTYSNEAGGMVVLIEEVLILPEFQGKGVVSKVFDMLAEEYDSKAARYRLEVTRINNRAIEIYKHFGYTEVEYISMIRDLREKK